MMISDKKSRSKFRCQKETAKRRGIKFLLTYEEWMKIWLDSGHWLERGRKRGQYQMARIGDKGPYAVGNVKIVTVEQNRSEQIMGTNRSSPGEKSWNAKLTAKLVQQIRAEYIPFSTENNTYTLAIKYGVRPQTIQSIIKRRLWKHL